MKVKMMSSQRTKKEMLSEVIVKWRQENDEREGRSEQG
jgi:hypothetical protein